MSVHSGTTTQWQRRSLVGLFCLVVLAPAFTWAAQRVGYAEPMDNAIELAGASSEIASTGISIFTGYSIPGFGPYVGTFSGALLGTVLTLGAALVIGRLLAGKN